MEKTLTIDGRQIRFKASAALTLHYATHFGSDALADALGAGKNTGANTLFMYRLVWSMAYCADKSIPPMEEWVDGFESLNIYKGVQRNERPVLGQSQRCILKKLSGEGEPLTTPGLLAISRKLGLSLADLESITIGIIMDICAEFDGNAEKQATQADFDAF
jgi:hypothetical protein